VALGTAAAAVLLANRDSQVGHRPVADPFRRPPTPSDRLPAWKPLDDEFLATRRIAVYERKGRTAGLYLARTRTLGRCLILVAGQAAGSSCNPHGYRISPLTVMYGLHYASGIVRNDVRSVIVVGTNGRRHRIRVSPGGGFIYRCPAFSGCIASIRSIGAYNGDGRLVSGDPVPRA
jgi:hypothetical protein